MSTNLAKSEGADSPLLCGKLESKASPDVDTAKSREHDDSILLTDTQTEIYTKDEDLTKLTDDNLEIEESVTVKCEIQNDEDITIDVKKKYTIEKKDRKHDAHIKAVLFGSVLLNFFLLVLVGVTINYMVSDDSEGYNLVNMCLNCSQLKLHPNDDLSLYDIYVGNICCVKRGGNYSSMVEKLVTKKLQEKLISESPKYQPLYCNDETRIAAVIKLVGKLENISLSDNVSSRFPWLRWNKEVDNKAGLTADDIFITIGKTGIYQIYSQLVFHNSKDEGPSSSSIVPDRYYMHAIYKFSGQADEQKILGGSYSYYQYQNGETEITSYIGSPYQLRKGEKLGIKVHNVMQVVPNNLTNFFGVYQTR